MVESIARQENAEEFLPCVLQIRGSSLSVVHFPTSSAGMSSPPLSDLALHTDDSMLELAFSTSFMVLTSHSSTATEDDDNQDEMDGETTTERFYRHSMPVLMLTVPLMLSCVTDAI
ncbi:hypothetical protein LEN26_021173 [Aphanomyces euteiches]|nr:hypothetical protein LEN26_021173 [Aphanomyces euteiches]KAH9123961.1 hypothetical protein AeMF1_005172 [Aphanomyces euteiches]KAH9195293.1 hypothetical protein AeNC1_002706 [Aphanomyces euteiches]